MISALLEMLGGYYQAGNLDQVEAVARCMLNAIPDDLVALQFLALALHQRGRIKDAYAVLRRVAQKSRATPRYPSTGEQASAACYREATRFGSQLAGGWYQIARLLSHYGFKEQAARALKSAQAATTDRRLSLRTAEV